MVRTVAEIEAEERSSGGLSYAPRPKRVGVVADYLEERWPSMDLAAELTSLAVARHAEGAFHPAILRPRLARVLRGRLSLGEHGARNFDRYLGRYLSYPRWLKPRARGFDLFHVIDQSYAHLVNVLPAGRAVVTCHDLDAFRSLIGEERETRPFWFRQTMKRILKGFQAAAHVICDSDAIRLEILARRLVPRERLSVVPLPVHPDFGPHPGGEADDQAAKLLGRRDPADADLLHVGANVPRKNIPFLLEVFAAVRRRHPRARLVRVGGGLTDDQRGTAERLGVGDAIVTLPHLDRPVLAAVYRHASALLLPSEREGFGWPVLEAMACGTPVVASAALPTVREIGGEAIDYAPADDVQGWIEAVDRLLQDRADRREWNGRRAAALERAQAFSLESYAAGILPVYRHVLGMKA
ncbi:MAG TPA: glycosyltransferase family 1 protein [Longimicrobium sp.]|nr:glycosyltransferase family 1 protein [Longimicrobium sp.]